MVAWKMAFSVQTFMTVLSFIVIIAIVILFFFPMFCFRYVKNCLENKLSCRKRPENADYFDPAANAL
jgi:uncharacterized membrane protein